MRLSRGLAYGGLAGLLAAGCQSGDAEEARRRDMGQATATAAPTATPRPKAPPAPPAPDAALPKRPEELATQLTRTTTRLNAAIEAWTGDPRREKSAPPADVTLWALHHQRVYRLLAHDRDLADRTVDRLSGARAKEARDHITAVREILDLADPVSRADARRIRTRPPPPAHELRRHMRDAEERFGVDWELLAAIMHVETKFGRVRSASSTGAQGPMQFMPPTWRQYGMDGDVHDPKDAVLGAANYLKASGAPDDVRRAVFAYNHDDRYVRSVLAHTRRIKDDPRAFYTYYLWQVFALTKDGDLRLTGPGAG